MARQACSACTAGTSARQPSLQLAQSTDASSCAGLEEGLLCPRPPGPPLSSPQLPHGGPLPVHPGRVPGRDGAHHAPGAPVHPAAPSEDHGPGWHPPGPPPFLAPGGAPFNAVQGPRPTPASELHANGVMFLICRLSLTLLGMMMQLCSADRRPACTAFDPQH